MIIVFPGGPRPPFSAGSGRFGPAYCRPRIPFRFGTPSGPQSELGAPPWAPLWNSCCSAPRSGDPLGTFQESFKAKNENLKIRQLFPSKIEPRRTFADPGPPKKGPLGPDSLSRGPPWKFLRGQTHVSGPSLAPPLEFLFLCPTLRGPPWDLPRTVQSEKPKS